MGRRFHRRRLWVAMALAPCLAHCAGGVGAGAEAARSKHRTSTAGVFAAADAGSVSLDGSAIAAAAPAAADAASTSARPAAADVAEDDCLNFRETHHRVEVETIGPDAARLTVTRTFEVRFPTLPFCMDHWIVLSRKSVFDSFALQTDGTWRQATIGRDRKVRAVAYRHGGPEQQPWASVEWANGDARLLIPPFWPSQALQIRYTIWTHGELQRGARRWDYCPEEDSFFHNVVVPEVSASSHDPDLVIGRDAESPDCVKIERPTPPGKSLSGRYGIYRLDDGLWWWSLEVAAPESSPTAPEPFAGGPVVFALDGSRSMNSRAGLAQQIAIVKAFVRDTPGAEVELLRVSRTADRVFGRFVPASEIDAALAAVPEMSLTNGSFLDRGAEVAADILRADGRPGHVILMTDGELRSRFNLQAAIAALKRAPQGTVAHLLYPQVRRDWFGPTMGHIVPEGLDELAAALGGASYAVILDARDPLPGSHRPSLPSSLERLVRPYGIESLQLHAGPRIDWPNQNDRSPESTGSNEVEFGDAATWTGFSTQRPPERMSLTGWIWGKKVELSVPRDPALERILPRVAMAAGPDTVYCKDPKPHLRRALAEGFLVPGLAFWVPGSGDGSGLVSASEGDEPDCESDPGYHFGGHHRFVVLPRSELAPLAREALVPCGVAPGSTGTIRARVEAQRGEVLDVSVEGSAGEQRRCIEEALWSMTVPEDFDLQGQRYTRTEYLLTLASLPVPVPMP